VSAATTVSTKDRDRMAADLKRLGLYAMSNDVGKGRSKLTDGVAHVRDYCLPNVLKGIAKYEAGPDFPPGSWGWYALPNMRARRDELQAFLNDWWAYDFEPEANR
jgi:hypothetical protein